MTAHHPATRCHSSIRRLPLVLILFLGLFPGLALGAEPRIGIADVSQEIADNIRAHLGLAREGCDLPDWRRRPLLRNADGEIRAALRALGHYEPVFTLDFKRTQTCWSLDITLDPGPPVRVRTLDIQIMGEAEQDPVFTDLLQSLPLGPGDRLRHDRYEQIKSSLNRQAAARGYLQARMTTSQMRVDVSAQAADLIIHLDSGPRHVMGPVTLDQDAFHDRLVRRFIAFEPGEVYDSQRLIALQQAFIDSGYFSDVRVEPRIDEVEQQQVPIQVTLTPRNRWSYLAGVGVTTDKGPRMRLGLENHRVNRAGHRYQAELSLSAVDTRLGLGYDIPLGDPARERIGFTGGYQRERTDTTDSDLHSLGITHLRQLPSGWTRTRSLTFEQEDYKVADIRDSTTLLMPGFQLSRVQTDHPIFPRQGWRLNLSLRGASEDILSTLSFAQATGRARYIMPLGEGRLLLRADAGTTAVQEFVTLPSSIRFFAGGDNSVRGYGYRKLGPTNDNGDIIGGRHLASGSIEMDYPFAEQWSMAMFADGGNAFNHLNDWNVRYGVGAGVRWRSPIGPIRVDIAHPIDGKDNFRLHLTMGMDL
ncbi:translocation and assembly module TamA [Ectothiorhodospira magna]|uniref:Translocation and assembly module subunit TamA n=1 Tax=Ectothiorhodospira magna TaxID=867345 RepID=A0A1H9BQ16_9GAMM|nr:autotransporter assembly complex family protein [Ectothiorhodospira magna]SEP90498.1 translocation and assembly module TamA [Ectothiorhodospira magna]